MEALGAVVFSLLVILSIFSPMVLVEWSRNRRQEMTRRQIALTDAIHRELGPIVSPVVKRRLWGTWQIRIAVPFARPAAVGKLLGLAHEVVSVADRMNPGRYEIVLTPQRDSFRKETETHAPQSAGRWPGDTRIAA